MWSEKQEKTKNKDATGILETGEIAGAFFLIKTCMFREINYFDEKYFFCPEDVAVSYNLRKRGYKCFVDANTVITHYEGMSGGKTLSMIKTATAPASTKGGIMFYSHQNIIVYCLLALITSITLLPEAFVHLVRGLFAKRPNSDFILWKGNWNSIKACFSMQSPKELFVKYYNKIRK